MECLFNGVTSIALITNHNNYAGKEYISTLIEANIDFDILLIGNYPAVSEREDRRCANLWKPPEYNKQARDFYYFDSLSSPKLEQFLFKKSYDLGIQGGTGILRKNIIKAFKMGILNFHPGDLPKYRGCMCPEWQLLENQPIVSTCHLIDEGIDTGSIYKKKVLPLPKLNYHKIRAQIYIEMSIFAVEVIKEILAVGVLENISQQDETEAIYRKVMPNELLELVKMKLES